MKYKIEVMYRDASNCKDYLTIERDSDDYPAVATLNKGDDSIEMESIGLEPTDFDMIQKYGFGKDDHNLVEIEDVKPIKS